MVTGAPAGPGLAPADAGVTACDNIEDARGAVIVRRSASHDSNPQSLRLDLVEDATLIDEVSAVLMVPAATAAMTTIDAVRARRTQ